MIEKVLIIQLKQIGDVLLTTPSIKALYLDKPEREIHFLTQKPSDQIFEHNPYIKKIILSQPKPGFMETLRLIKKLRAEKYDIVIDYLGSPNTALLGWLTGARTRIGFNFRGRRWFYNHALEIPNNVYYSAQHKLALLAPLQIDPSLEKIDFFISNKDLEKADEILDKLEVARDSLLISISPVSRRDYKVWPAEKFAALCDFLISKYSAQVLFLWGPGEYHFIKAIREKMKHSPLPDFKTETIKEVRALFEHITLHIGNDNGQMHFAISASTPTVAIFGQGKARNWTPPNAKKHLFVEYDPGCKSQCSYPKCKLECILDLQLEEVIKVVEQQMKNIAATRL